jgi:hypothetical protein
MIRRRAARLTRDYGIDPETQNLEDGSWKWPSIRKTLSYNSPERCLERQVIRSLLGSPEARFLVLGKRELFRALGAGWKSEIQRFTPSRIRRVQHLVCESCVGVSLRLTDDNLIVRVLA